MCFTSGVVFGELASAVEGLSVPADAAALRELLGLRDRLDALTHAAVGEFDAARLWDEWGLTSLRAWLCDAGLCGPDATRMARISSRLTRLPVLRAAWLAGEVSAGQVRAVDANLIDRHIPRFSEHEAGLVPTLVGLSAADTNRVMAEWRARADALDTPADGEADVERSLAHSATLGGRFVTQGSFDAYGGETIAAALGAADSRDLAQPPPQRRADALVEVCRFFLAHRHRQTAGANRPHINLIVDADDLHGGRAETVGSGLLLDPTSTALLLCDCTLSRVVAQRIGKAVSRILDLGHSTPIVSPAQRAALAIRDRGCRWPGCDRPGSWCDAHHVVWVTRGGPTDLGNLVLLCSLCRRRHKPHYADSFVMPTAGVSAA